MAIFLTLLPNRNEIAVSAEKSYQSLSLKEAAEVFQIQNESQFNKFLDVEKEKGFDRGYNWTIDGNRLHFKPVRAIFWLTIKSYVMSIHYYYYSSPSFYELQSLFELINP